MRISTVRPKNAQSDTDEPVVLPAPSIVVSDTLRGPHALLKWMPLRKHPWRAAGSHLNMVVSKESLSRANRIMDALIKTTELEGWVWCGEVGTPTLVTVNGINIKIMVRELRVAKKVKNAPGAWREFTRTLEWTGRICISIDDWQARGSQKKWRDTSKIRLESMLRKVVVGIREVAVVLKQARELREAEKRSFSAAWKKREALERELKEVQRKQDALVAMATEWAKVESLRRFLKSASDRIGQLPENKRLLAMDWLRWAQAQADAIDRLHGDWSQVIEECGVSLDHHGSN